MTEKSAKSNLERITRGDQLDTKVHSEKVRVRIDSGFGNSNDCGYGCLGIREDHDRSCVGAEDRLSVLRRG